MRRVLIVTAATVVLAAGSAAQLPPGAGAARSEETRGESSSETIQAGPGGGQMIILAPDRQYVIRARTSESGAVHLGCAREEERGLKSRGYRAFGPAVGEKDTAPK